jgi:hypothetical protein
MVEQRVEDVESFAGGRRDDLGGEWRVAVGKVGVELDSRLVAVMGVEARGGASASGRPEELTVRGRRRSAAEDRRQWFPVLLVGQTPQRRG